MEDSETQKRIINLGKEFVLELSLDRVDSLAHWMAYYIAEQIENAENSTGRRKIEAEKDCFETILKLWQHRSSLPDGTRPFESFEPIFRILSRLDPENPRPYYYSSLNNRSSKQDGPGDEHNEVQQWLDIAEGIDQVARILLEFVFHQAVKIATDEKTVSWLENAAGISNNEDLSIIIQLAYPVSENESEEITEKQVRAKQEGLEKKITKLDAFVDFSQLLRAELVSELKALTKAGSSD